MVFNSARSVGRPCEAADEILCRRSSSGCVQVSNPCEASFYPLEIVLKPEATAVYCLSKNTKHLAIGEHEMFFTADIGGGTVDIVVHKILKGTAPASSKLQVHYIKGNFCCIDSFLIANCTISLRPDCNFSLKRTTLECKNGIKKRQVFRLHLDCTL